MFSASLQKIYEVMGIESLEQAEKDELLKQLTSSETIRRMSNDEFILQPHQVADVLTCVVTKNPDTLARLGRLSETGVLDHSEDTLRAVWGDYPEAFWLCQEGKISPFLQLLYDSGLAYQVFDAFGRSQGRSIVPCILNERPEGFDGGVKNEKELLDHFFRIDPKILVPNKLGFESLGIEFNFLPFIFFARLLAELRTMATDGGAWRNGTVLSAGVSFALITEQRHSIKISYFGNNRSVRSVALLGLLEVMKKFRSMAISEVCLTREGRKWNRDDIEEALFFNNGVLFSHKTKTRVEVHSLWMLFPIENFLLESIVPISKELNILQKVLEISKLANHSMDFRVLVNHQLRACVPFLRTMMGLHATTSDEKPHPLWIILQKQQSNELAAVP